MDGSVGSFNSLYAVGSGDNLSIEAIPDTGYKVVVIDNDVEIGNPSTLENIDDYHLINLNVTESPKYIVSVDAGYTNFISPNEVEVYEGYNATFTYSHTGYRLCEWLLDGNKTGVTSETFEIQDIGKNHSVGASEEMDAYSVTVDTDGNGRAYAEGIYQYGVQMPTLHATPAENWIFKGWYYNDALVSTDRDYTPTGSYPREPLTFRAVFIERFNATVDLIVYPDDKFGSVFGGGEYYIGDTVSITAVANKGYRFVRWCLGVEHKAIDEWKEVSTSPTYEFTIASRGDTYRAEFEEVSDTLPPDRQAVMDAIVRIAVPVRELAAMIEDTEKPIDRGLLRKYLATLSSFARKLSEVEENVLNI